jgi:hypothetical protein
LQRACFQLNLQEAPRKAWEEAVSFRECKQRGIVLENEVVGGTETTWAKASRQEVNKAQVVT